MSLREQVAGRQGTHLCLVDLQQHRPCSEAAVIEQHVGQDGQLGGGALQGPGVLLQGLLRPGSQSQRGRWTASGRERGDERERQRNMHTHAETRRGESQGGVVRRKQEADGQGRPTARLHTAPHLARGSGGPLAELDRAALRTGAEAPGPLDPSEEPPLPPEPCPASRLLSLLIPKCTLVLRGVLELDLPKPGPSEPGG